MFILFVANFAEGESGDEGEKETPKQHRDSFVEAPDAPRLDKVRHSLKKMEAKRNEFLVDKHVIGRVSNRRRDIVKELASISNRKVPFKWQRGNKIGRQLQRQEFLILECLILKININLLGYWNRNFQKVE